MPISIWRTREELRERAINPGTLQARSSRRPALLPLHGRFRRLHPYDAQTIRETRSVVEKHLPAIIAEFYAQLLRFPATRKPFLLKKDGTVDEDYLELRMQHQANFWRRTMTANFDDDYARFVDYVGRAHTCPRARIRASTSPSAT